MPAEEHIITIEIVCTKLPGTQWGGPGTVHLGIQRNKDFADAQPADRESIVFRPEFRVRRQPDGSPNFLGPFAQGPRQERFIYLNWVTMVGKSPVASPGRVKLHLNHIEWAHVEKAVIKKKALKVTLQLTTAKGRPVFASVRANAALWELG